MNDEYIFTQLSSSFELNERSLCHSQSKVKSCAVYFDSLEWFPCLLFRNLNKFLYSFNSNLVLCFVFRPGQKIPREAGWGSKQPTYKM